MKFALSCVAIKWFRLDLTQSSAIRELMLMVTYKMLGSVVMEINKQENTVISMVIVVNTQVQGGRIGFGIAGFLHRMLPVILSQYPNCMWSWKVISL